MKKHFFLAIMAVVCLPVIASAQKWEGLADTPQMGWNSWNKFHCDINEDLIKATADKMVELGLVDAGYVYLNLDDCWHGQRDEQGFVHEDPEKFPSGMKALCDYVHSKGLKFGIYSDAGTNTCACFAGSNGHEYQDAYTYAQWGVDYLKYDWCYASDLNAKGAYRTMRDALRAAGRPIFFSMCEWGSNKPWEWATEIGHSWRTTGDIGPGFIVDPVHPDGSWNGYSVCKILDLNEPLRAYAGPGHWNDPDMLEVGNGMSVSEDRAHFSLWCMMAAPLLLGNDLTNMSQETLDIITNRDVIAIDQDRLGVQGLRYKQLGLVEFWFKPLADGSWAFCIFNRGETVVKTNIDWADFCFTDELSGLSTDFDKVTYTAKDLWNAAEKPFATRGKVKGKKGINCISKYVTVQPHDVVVYRLDKVVAKK